VVLSQPTRTRNKTLPLTGKVGVITGASRGIGAAIARELAAYGADLVLNYSKSAEQADALARELYEESDAGAIVVIRADVSKADEAADLIKQTYEHFGRIDMLVNNAGITRDRTVRKMTTEEWCEVIETNLSGTFYCIQAAAPYLIEQGGGRVVTISSVMGLSGNVGQANYSAAKAGLIGMTKSLALEWARYNVTVNCVAPGFIDTDMLAHVPEAIRTELTNRIPLHRFGNPDEVAKAVRYLCVDGEYITGAVLNINGGLYM
jgi:acetoacetyl-CoA reductase